MHLLSHSSGSWFVNRMMQRLADNAAIHLTFFDAFNNPAKPCPLLPLRPYCGRFQSQLGDGTGSDDFVEHYVDRYFVSLPGTDDRLPKAVNFDVTDAMIPSSPFHSGALGAGHSWPYKWYLETVRQANQSMSLFPDPACNGFVLSPEFIESQGLPFAERNLV